MKWRRSGEAVVEAVVDAMVEAAAEAAVGAVAEVVGGGGGGGSHTSHENAKYLAKRPLALQRLHCSPPIYDALSCVQDAGRGSEADMSPVEFRCKRL